MLNKKYTEADVRQLFTGHGTIEECTVLRDQVGQSKGCAFVTFATKQNAIGAIKVSVRWGGQGRERVLWGQGRGGLEYRLPANRAADRCNLMCY